jgi:hypothetical protein
LTCSKPSLILHDLKNTDHKSKAVYEYIDTYQKTAPIGLHGTSGAGKTRSVFEYLSHNFGFYFVVETDNNPGSQDVAVLLEICEERMSSIPLPAVDETGEIRLSAKDKSKANLRIVFDLLTTLMGVRHAVFKRINTALHGSRGKSLSCHEWLLLQLYPTAFLGKDVFADLFRKLCDEEVKITKVSAQMSCFMDEAQVLLEKLESFFVTKDGTQKRSAYSAFANGLRKLALRGGSVHYPCFSGTGLSIDQIKNETASLMAKPAAHPYFFTGLKSMSADDVKMYMKTFLGP